MKIFQFRGQHPNFGDELNGWLWPKLLPHFFDDDTSVHFIGIGSTIGDAPRDATKKIVFGAGFVPNYHHAPDLHDGHWQVYFVRGPRTALRLNLAPELAISDAGILLRTQVDLAQKRAETIAFMPHWESMDRGNWQQACAQAGVTLIDPRRPVEEVIAALLEAKLVIAEAMHGAIIADALRIAWVPLLPLNHVHRDKWFDWAESLDLALRPQRLWPSTLTELSNPARRRTPLAIAQESPPARPRLLSRTKQAVQSSPLAPWMDARLTDLASYRLRQLARREGMLSRDTAMETATARMLEKLDQLRRDDSYKNACA